MWKANDEEWILLKAYAPEIKWLLHGKSKTNAIIVHKMCWLFQFQRKSVNDREAKNECDNFEHCHRANKRLFHECNMQQDECTWRLARQLQWFGYSLWVNTCAFCFAASFSLFFFLSIILPQNHTKMCSNANFLRTNYYWMTTENCHQIRMKRERVRESENARSHTFGHLLKQ